MDGDRHRIDRLRWRCRRGMLENDLVLSRYLDARGAELSGDEVTQFDRLLALSDHALWDLIAGRAEPADPRVLPLVERLRAI